MPNPALQIGNLRLQAVNFALLLFIIFRSRLIQPRAVAAWMYLAIPAVTCAMFYLFAQLFATETLKLCALWLLGTVYIVPGTLRGESDLRALLQGISLGIILNLAISALQLITVPADAYPFWSWYGYGPDDTGMIRGLQSGAGIFGVRTFGWFSEPSDMTASIGHWWLLLCALRLGAGGRDLSSSCICKVALFAGAPLLMLSRSGHALIVAAGFLILLAAALRTRVGSSRAGALTLALAAALAVGLYDLKDRIVSPEAIMAGHSAGSVWEARAASIRDSLGLWQSASPREFIFGLGYNGVEKIKFETGYNVWSVIGKSILEFGLVAVCGWLLLAVVLIREVWLSGAPLLGLVFACTCILAIGITTSYEPLTSPWLGLGVLLSWRRVFGTRVQQLQPAWAHVARKVMECTDAR